MVQNLFICINMRQKIKLIGFFKQILIGQTSPDEFKKFWDLKENYNAIIGNRIVRGDGRLRKFVEKVLCFILKLIFGVSVPDANAPFRLMKTELVEKYINRFDDAYNLPNVMLTTYFVYYKENVKFEEISFKQRQNGNNSINIKKIIMIGFKSLKDFWNLKKQCKQNGEKYE